jgi:hypothetical protein
MGPLAHSSHRLAAACSFFSSACSSLLVLLIGLQQLARSSHRLAAALVI